MVGLVDQNTGNNPNNSALNQAAVGLVDGSQRNSFRDSQGGERKSVEDPRESQKFILNEKNVQESQPYNQTYEPIEQPIMRDSYRDSYNSNNRPFSFGEQAVRNSQPLPNIETRAVTTTS